MPYRDLFHISHLSVFLLLYPATLFTGDKHAGKVYFEDPVTGHVSMTGGAPKMPGVPMDIAPTIPDAPTGGGGAKGLGGIVGFFINLGRTSEADKRAADRADKAARALEAQTAWSHVGQIAGIPAARTPKEEAALLKQLTQQAQAFTSATAPAAPAIAPVVKAAAPVVVAAPVVAAAIIDKVASSTATIPATYSFKAGAPGGITCLPPFDTESFGSGVSSLSSSIVSGMPPKAPPIPDMSQLLRDNPFKDLPGKGGGGLTGGLVAGGVIGAKTVAAATTTNTVATTAGTTTGGAVATTGFGAAVIALAPAVAIGTVLGLSLAGGVIGTYEFFARPKDGIFFRAKNPVVNIPQSNHNSSSNNIPSAPDPKKPEEPKERKFNKVQRTDAMNKIKKNYEFDRQSNSYRLKDNGKPIINTMTGKPIKRVYWDGQHGDIEAWKGLKQGNHLGSLDPQTFEMYKGPDLNRTLL